MEYIVVEMSKSSFVIAKKLIGSEDKYNSVATCRSRNQAENLVNLLNGDKEDAT